MASYYIYLFIFNKQMFVYLFDCASLLVVVYELLVVACGILFLDQGSNLGTLRWECRFLAPGPPGKSISYYI